jgi:hypothetical protein
MLIEQMDVVLVVQSVPPACAIETRQIGHERMVRIRVGVERVFYPKPCELGVELGHVFRRGIYVLFSKVEKDGIFDPLA